MCLVYSVYSVTQQYSTFFSRSAMCLRLLANIQFRYIILNVHCYPCFCFIFARQNYCHQKCRANMSGICQGCIFSLIEASWWCSVQHLFLCVKITAIMLTNNLETSGAPSWWYWKETLLWVSSEQMNHVTYASICSYISIQYYYSAPGSALCWVWNDKLELSQLHDSQKSSCTIMKPKSDSYKSSSATRVIFIA